MLGECNISTGEVWYLIHPWTDLSGPDDPALSVIYYVYNFWMKDINVELKKNVRSGQLQVPNNKREWRGSNPRSRPWQGRMLAATPHPHSVFAFQIFLFLSRSTFNILAHPLFRVKWFWKFVIFCYIAVLVWFDAPSILQKAHPIIPMRKEKLITSQGFGMLPSCISRP